jgi:hypothetical protein
VLCILLRRIPFLLCLVLLVPQLAAQQDPATLEGLKDKRILVLTSYGAGRPGVETLLQGFRSTLNRAGISEEQIFTENLDLGRAGDVVFRHSLAEALRAKYRQRHTDLVYVLEQPALDFCFQELAGVVRGVPILVVRANLPERLEGTGWHFVNQLGTYDLDGTVHLAAALFPKTRHVLFIAGNTESDQAVLAQANRTRGYWKGDVAYENTIGFTLDQVMAKVRAPAPNTIIVILPFNRDAAGRTAVQMEVAFNIAAQADAPVFTLWDNPVGQGAVGGSVTNFSTVGQQAAEIGLELLRGRKFLTDTVTNLPARFIPKFDWLQIERWHGDSARSPSKLMVRVPAIRP